MSLSGRKRTAPLSLLCCGRQNGGGVNGVGAPVQTLSHGHEHEAELDGYTEEGDTQTVPSGINEAELPVESRIKPPQDRGSEKLVVSDVEMETYALLRHFYRSYIGLPVPYKNKSHAALPTLHRVVGKVVCRHRVGFSAMVRELIDNRRYSLGIVLRVVFRNGVISWGRIASILALGAMVCERLKQDYVKDYTEECVDIIALHISSYIGTALRLWFINHNGWDGFVEHFHVPDLESAVRNVLMVVAGLGIGACLLILVRSGWSQI